jgi:hypothetical protein
MCPAASIASLKAILSAMAKVLNSATMREGAPARAISAATLCAAVGVGRLVRTIGAAFTTSVTLAMLFRPAPLSASIRSGATS